ncbi:MAG: hypothetical protein ACAH11_13685 [Sphingomonas sp.]
MLTLMLLMAMQDALPKITVTQVDGNRYSLDVAAFPVSEKRGVDLEMVRLARRACGDRQPVWGVLQTRGPLVGESVPTFTMYRRDFQCLERDTTVYPPAPADWGPTPKDDADARKTFATYFSRVDSGDLEGAYAMYEPRAVPDRDDWLVNQRRAQKALGHGTMRITAIRWERNPPDERHPGAFATIIFDGDYPAADAVCGLITVYRRGPGDYVIVGQEFNFLLKRAAPMTPEAIEETKRERCPR